MISGKDRQSLQGIAEDRSTAALSADCLILFTLPIFFFKNQKIWQGKATSLHSKDIEVNNYFKGNEKSSNKSIGRGKDDKEIKLTGNYKG